MNRQVDVCLTSLIEGAQDTILADGQGQSEGGGVGRSVRRRRGAGREDIGQRPDYRVHIVAARTGLVAPQTLHALSAA
jgi:hypothetical protein